MSVLYQVSAQTAIYSERVAIVLGFVTLVLVLALFVSCRTFVSLVTRLGAKDPSRLEVYRRFNKYHMYYWWFFGVSVLSHVMMATLHTGLPQAGDPDAAIHWTILILGLFGAFSSVVLFSSCRISPRLLAPTVPKLSFANRSYRSFFGYHSYYWWAFILFVAAHFAAGYLHAGIWPGLG